MSEKQGWFGETTKKDWILAAGKELGDDKPLQKLSYRRGDLTLLPYYDASDLPSSRIPHTVQHGKQWVNAPRVAVEDAKAANGAALQHLRAGANGIFFEIINTSIDLQHLFSGIELPFCSIFFYGNVTTGLLENFSSYTKSQFEPKEIRGAAYGLPLKAVNGCRAAFEDFTQFNIQGLIITSQGLEINSFTNFLVELHARQPLESRLHSSAVLLSLSDDFFNEIIRIRTIELLWACYCAAYRETAELFVHCRSSPFLDTDFEPHGNMIAATSRAISALVGGAHAITIDAGTPGTLGERIARNISFIAQEEAQLTRSGNPVMGSYFVESAARQLAEKAWSQFQATIKS